MTPQGPTPPPGPNQPSGPSKIQHTRPGIGPQPVRPSPATPDPDEPVAMAPRSSESTPGETSGLAPRIRPIEARHRHEETWTRTPNTHGTGAIHVRTFHCKLTEDALRFMDQTINEWLDAHPQYEVKFVNSTIGTFTGKLKEPALICQVWV